MAERRRTGSSDVAIVGGGLAGLTAAIDLARRGRSVLVLEKGTYPRHRVCGEYVSNEVLPYLRSLDVPLDPEASREVRRFQLHVPSGRSTECALPLGGFGLRRFTLDHRLYRAALSLGVRFELGETIREVSPLSGARRFLLRSRNGLEWESPVVLGSYGKRSLVENRANAGPRSSDRSSARATESGPKTSVATESGRTSSLATQVVGMKFYLDTPFPSDLVALYTFPGGYAGAVRVEDGSVDIALIVSRRTLRRAGSLRNFEHAVLWQNPALKRLLTGANDGFPERPQTIASLRFGLRDTVRDQVLLIGDAAGMIPPVAGNGMAMAVEGARLAAKEVEHFLAGECSRAEMEQNYDAAWRAAFGTRMRWGRWLHPVVERPLASELAVRVLRAWPRLLPPIIARTHGTA